MPQAPAPEPHHRGSPATPGCRGRLPRRSRSRLRPSAAARSTGTGQRWWPTTPASQTHASRRRSDDAEFELAYADDIVQVQLPAATSLRFSIDRDGLGREQRLDFSSAADDALQLQQLTEVDRVSPNGHVAPHQPNGTDRRPDRLARRDSLANKRFAELRRPQALSAPRPTRSRRSSIRRLPRPDRRLVRTRRRAVAGEWYLVRGQSK